MSKLFNIAIRKDKNCQFETPITYLISLYDVLLFILPDDHIQRTTHAQRPSDNAEISVSALHLLEHGLWVLLLVSIDITWILLKVAGANVGRWERALRLVIVVGSFVVD